MMTKKLMLLALVSLLFVGLSASSGTPTPPNTPRSHTPDTRPATPKNQTTGSGQEPDQKAKWEEWKQKNKPR